MRARPRRLFLAAAFTAILIGYLAVWLPGPGAGLSFLGVEMGEWFKFVGLGPRRDLFYLPPITLGLMLALWTVTWPRGASKAWLMRGLAVLVSLLAFPAIEDISGPVREQYLLRAFLVGLVIAVALLSAFWHPGRRGQRLVWGLLLLLGLLGLLLPTWLFLQVRPFASELFGVPVSFGLGVWLNAAGHLLVVVVSGLQLTRGSSPTSSARPRKTQGA